MGAAMPVAKLFPGNDVIEGSVAVCPITTSQTYTHDDPSRSVHTTDPTAGSFAENINSRFNTGDWAEWHNPDIATASHVSAPSGTNTEANITFDAVANQSHAIYGIGYSYNGLTNGSGVLTIEAGSGNIVFKEVISTTTSGRNDEVRFNKPLRTTRGSSMIVRLTGVPGVKGVLSVLGHRME